MFGTFAGCYNSHLVTLDQCRETSFLFGAVSTWWVIFFFAFILASLFFAILRSALLCSCSCACFPWCLVNNVWTVVHFGLALARWNLKLCVAMLRDFPFEKINPAWATNLEALPSVARCAAIFIPRTKMSISAPIRWWLQERKDEITFWSFWRRCTKRWHKEKNNTGRVPRERCHAVPRGGV